MTKRGAETYLTDRNWDEEDDPEEPGEFAVASEDVLKQRPIIKAKRRCASSTADGDKTKTPFEGFKGLTETGKSEKSSTSFFFKPNVAPSTALTGSLGPSETMEELNRRCQTKINERLAENPQTNLTPLMLEYSAEAKKLQQVSPTSSAETTGTTGVPLSELFKKTSDTWDCTTCYVSNKASSDACVACSAPKPATSAPKPSTEQTSSSDGKDSSSSWFKPAEGWQCQECWVNNKVDQDKCACCQASKPAGKSDDKSSVSSSTSSSEAIGSTTTFGPQGGFSFKLPSSTAFTGFNLPVSSSASSTATSSTLSSTTSGFKFDFSTRSTGLSSLPVGESGFRPGFKLIDASLGAAAPLVYTPPDSEAKEPADEEDYEPPKPEGVSHTEEGAFFNAKCKLFYMKDESWQDRGIGHLFLKPCEKKTQLLIRADTSIGNIMLNVLISSNTPISRQGGNCVSLVCIPNPPIESIKSKSKSPVCMLIRVKTAELADMLLKKLIDCKTNADSEAAEQS